MITDGVDHTIDVLPELGPQRQTHQRVADAVRDGQHLTVRASVAAARGRGVQRDVMEDGMDPLSDQCLDERRPLRQRRVMDGVAAVVRG